MTRPWGESAASFCRREGCDRHPAANAAVRARTASKGGIDRMKDGPR